MPATTTSQEMVKDRNPVVSHQVHYDLQDLGPCWFEEGVRRGRNGLGKKLGREENDLGHWREMRRAKWGWVQMGRV